ncbi:MAG: phosphate ABC transporter permease PstA [Proteobacteria bacterium]|nr:phosphate ABC transporter permease PstA [Pseudomonadota bacterium]MDA0927561.1 phosphate ABC transporter permease PstA [Pseudomonadota bacterium]
MKKQKLSKFQIWLRDGTPWIWFNAGAVTISVLMLFGLLVILGVNGLSHFWPRDVMRAVYTLPTADGIEEPVEIIGEIISSEETESARLQGSGLLLNADQEILQRQLIRFGNRDLGSADFGWIFPQYLSEQSWPEDITVLERREWSDFYGRLQSLQENGQTLAVADPFEELQRRLQRTEAIHAEINAIEDGEIARINWSMEQLRLGERRLQLEGNNSAEIISTIRAERQTLLLEFEAVQSQLNALYRDLERDTAQFEAANGVAVTIFLADIVRAYRPNAMGVVAKLGVYFEKLAEFLTTEPREANTEGGIFPAIFGTVVMVLLMSVFVTPFGVVAAIYLREYAHQGFLTRLIRIAVNNLAGVPSIVYGVFGLGFFIYFVGGEIDQAFYPEALPAPTFGTPGLLWASLTLALLTVPVVIVATEEGLARIPRSLREGSLALGATKFETIVQVIFPMASPAMMTGLILAVARAAGEVAPLMLVGVVKLAPALPVNGIYPYVHLDQKFMHLGYHIYDVGFQSPNIEAARPLVFATALLLVIVIATLNFAAAALRNRLREKYKTLDV